MTPKLALIQTLARAAAALADALRCEHSQAHARFISLCMAMEGGAC